MSSEEVNQQSIRNQSAFFGTYWRNNSGACEDAKTGRQIRYGLANDSAKVNDHVKSSDLIGVTPLLILPHHVGLTLGIFTAIEAKRTGWTLTPGDKRGIAQHRFHEIVWKNGGFAGFAQTIEDVHRIIRR